MLRATCYNTTGVILLVQPSGMTWLLYIFVSNLSHLEFLENVSVDFNENLMRKKTKSFASHTQWDTTSLIYIAYCVLPKVYSCEGPPGPCLLAPAPSSSTSWPLSSLLLPGSPYRDPSSLYLLFNPSPHHLPPQTCGLFHHSLANKLRPLGCPGSPLYYFSPMYHL